MLEVLRHRQLRLRHYIHAWIPGYFLHLVIGFFLLVIVPYSVLAFIFGWPGFLGSALFGAYFCIIALLGMVKPRRAYNPEAHATAERILRRKQLRRHYPQLRDVTDSIIDDIYQL